MEIPNRQGLGGRPVTQVCPLILARSVPVPKDAPTSGLGITAGNTQMTPQPLTEGPGTAANLTLIPGISVKLGPQGSLYNGRGRLGISVWKSLYRAKD